LERAKTYFSIVKHLDKKQFADADALFKTINNTNGWGGFSYERIARRLAGGKYDEARDLCSGDIDFWIIDTAADWQTAELRSLLDDPNRLQFLQELYVYRKKFPALTPEGQKSEALVADILRKANERKK